MKTHSEDTASATQKPKSPLPEHIPALDGLRGVAILYVLIFHLFPSLERFGFPSYLADLYIRKAGFLGVDLFFVLSGFLITNILVQQRNSPRLFKAFYGRRLVRIFPLYYICLVVFILVVVGSQAFFPPQLASSIGPDKLQNILWNFLYLGNLSPSWDAATPNLAHTWSLALEEQYYLLWPLLLLVLGALRTQVIATAGLIVALLAWRLVWVYGGFGINCYTLEYLDGILMGSLLALVYHLPGAAVALAKFSRLWIPLGLASIGVVYYADGHNIPGNVNFANAHSFLSYGITVVNLFFCAVIVKAVTGTQGWAPRLFSNPFLRHIGKYSYAIYLLHMFAFALALWGQKFLLPYLLSGPEDMRPLEGTVANVLVVVSTLVLTYLGARFTWVAIESPFLRFKRYFRY